MLGFRIRPTGSAAEVRQLLENWGDSVVVASVPDEDVESLSNIQRITPATIPKTPRKRKPTVDAIPRPRKRSASKRTAQANDVDDGEQTTPAAKKRGRKAAMTSPAVNMSDINATITTDMQTTPRPSKQICSPSIRTSSRKPVPNPRYLLDEYDEEESSRDSHMKSSSASLIPLTTEPFASHTAGSIDEEMDADFAEAVRQSLEEQKRQAIADNVGDDSDEDLKLAIALSLQQKQPEAITSADNNPAETHMQPDYGDWDDDHDATLNMHVTDTDLSSFNATVITNSSAAISSQPSRLEQSSLTSTSTVVVDLTADSQSQEDQGTAIETTAISNTMPAEQIIDLSDSQNHDQPSPRMLLLVIFFYV